MKCRWRSAYYALLVLALSLSGEAGAQSGSARVKADFDMRFDCERPLVVRNHPIRAEFKAVLNTDKSATADLAITGIIFTNRVHFDARLGGSQAAPGGTSQLRVAAANRLRAIWSLPNNQLILDIVSAGRTCSAKLNIQRKARVKEYSMFDGRRMYYCSKYRVLSSSCQPE